MGLVQTTSPTIEPVTLAEVKVNSRISYTDQDTLIPLLISAARRYAESYTNRSFITQGWRQTLDCFPWCIELDRSPVLAVSSITYLAMDGTTQTVPSGEYIVDTSSKPGRITPVFGKIWPIPMPQIGSVSVNYTAGYGPLASDVPEGIRQWILLRVATLYENREEVGSVSAIPGYDRLLDPYRVVTA